MRIAIVGAGGHGRVVLDILRRNHQFDLAGFLDGNAALHGVEIDGLPVLGDMSLIFDFPQLDIGAAVVAIGDNRTRLSHFLAFEKAGICLVSAIHPSSNIADSARIGKNVVIAAGTNICTHVTVGDSAILNTGCIVDHESHIHKAAHICPGVRIAGHVTVERSAFVGIGATIIQGITIGESAIVGAGAVVLEDVPPYSTVVGVPGRVVQRTHLQTDHEATLPSTADLEPARSMVRPRRLAPAPTPVMSQT